MGKKNAAIIIRPKTAKELDLELARMMHDVDRTKTVDVKTAMTVLAS